MKFKAILFVLICCASGLFGQSNHKGAEVKFMTVEGLTISATYVLPEDVSTPVPAIILIHQGGSTREEWFAYSLVDRLLEEGIAILAYDVRLHGKSGKDDGDIYDLFNNPNRSPFDLMGAFIYLFKDQRIDNERIGILGASIGANLACMASSSDQFLAKSVVSMSAKTSAAQNLSGLEEEIHPGNAFYIASEGEQEGKRAVWAKELHNKTTGKKKIYIANGEKHGSFIFEDDPKLEKKVVKWFKKTL